MIILSSNLLLHCGRCDSPVDSVEVGEVGAVNSPM